MNFIKRPKIAISIIILFIILIHFSQTNKIPPVAQKVLDLMSLMIGPVLGFLTICLGIYGILIFYKNILPNISDAEMRAIQRKQDQIKDKQRSDKQRSDKQKVITGPITGLGLMDKIKRLKRLHKNGILTKDEFEKAKNKLLK